MKTLFCLAATVLFVCVGLTIDARSTEFTISQPCFYSDGSAASGVTVTAKSTTTQRSYTTKSDLSGWGVVSVPSNQRYRVSGSIDGQEKSHSSDIMVSNSNVTCDPLYFD